MYIRGRQAPWVSTVVEVRPVVCFSTEQVVVTIARLVRSLLETPTHRVIFEELADADVIMELCEVGCLELAGAQRQGVSV
jgi:hypothetical protein